MEGEGRPRRNQNKMDSNQRGVKIYSHHLQKIKPTGEKWTYKELNKLYLSLCTYGSANVAKITQYVGTRSVNDVIGKIKHFERAAQLDLTTSKPDRIKIYDQWIQKLRSLDVSPRPGKVESMAMALDIIELFEEHPDPADVYGIDFKKAYRWLYDCYCGNTTKKLDVPTSAFLAMVCDNLLEEAFRNTCKGAEDLEKLLTAIKTRENEKNSNEEASEPPLKTYPGRKRHMEDTVDEDLLLYKAVLDHPNMNPLELPLEFWANP